MGFPRSRVKRKYIDTARAEHAPPKSGNFKKTADGSVETLPDRDAKPASTKGNAFARGLSQYKKGYNPF